MLFFSVPSDCLYLLQTFFSKNFEYGLLIVVGFFFTDTSHLEVGFTIGKGGTYICYRNKQTKLLVYTWGGPTAVKIWWKSHRCECAFSPPPPPSPEISLTLSPIDQMVGGGGGS